MCLVSPTRRHQGLVYSKEPPKNGVCANSWARPGSGERRIPAGGASAPPGHRPVGKGTGPYAAGRGERCPPAPLASPAPRPGLTAPALMRSIKRIIDVEVCCEVPAGGKRSIAADTGALICTTWLKPESRHFINGFSLC